jgi:hypothetical protein
MEINVQDHSETQAVQVRVPRHIPIQYHRTYMVIKWKNGVKLPRRQEIPVFPVEIW